MNRYAFRFKDGGELRKDIHVAYIAAMKHDTDAGFVQQPGRLGGDCKIPVRIGKNPYFHAAKIVWRPCGGNSKTKV